MTAYPFSVLDVSFNFLLITVHGGQVKEISGGAGYRSRYLSHAKRALYHLSYAPILKYSGQLEIFVAAAAVLSISLSDCVELVRTEVVSGSVG